MDPSPNTKWNHNILNKYNNQTKNKNPNTHSTPHSNTHSNTHTHSTPFFNNHTNPYSYSNPQPSGYNRVETFDTSPLQLPLLTPLFHFSNPPPVLQNRKELGNNTAPPNQRNEAFTNSEPKVYQPRNTSIVEFIPGYSTFSSLLFQKKPIQEGAKSKAPPKPPGKPNKNEIEVDFKKEGNPDLAVAKFVVGALVVESIATTAMKENTKNNEAKAATATANANTTGAPGAASRPTGAPAAAPVPVPTPGAAPAPPTDPAAAIARMSASVSATANAASAPPSDPAAAIARMSASVSATTRAVSQTVPLDECDYEEDEDDILVSNAAKPKYESAYTPRVNTIDITNTNLVSKLEQPQVENNPFTSDSMNTPVSEVKPKKEKFTNRWSSIIETLVGSDNQQPSLDDIEVSPEETYEDTIKKWKEIGDAIKEYNPLGMLKLACVFVYDELYVKIMLKGKFQQSLYGKMKENYFMFIYLLISILVTYNLFYLYFYRDFQNERIAFIPVEKLNGFYILNYVINPVKLMYSSLLIARDFIEEKLDEAYRKDVIGKHDKYKIIIIMLFLFSVLFVSQFMGILYDAFFNTLSLKNDDFGNYALIVIVIYGFYCFGLEVCNDPTLRFWPVFIVSLIRFIIILIISTSFTWLAVFLVCVIIFLSTVFPWMVIYSQQQFEIFQEINGFCHDLLELKRVDRAKIKEMAGKFMEEKQDVKDETKEETPVQTSLLGAAGKGEDSFTSTAINMVVPDGVAKKALKTFIKGGNCATDEKNECHVPKKGFMELDLSGKFALSFKNTALYLYKRVFYIAFIILLLVHITLYHQNIDRNTYKDFWIIQICVCSGLITLFLLLMYMTDQVTPMVGNGLMGVTGLTIIGLFFGYSVVIYNFFNSYAQYGASKAGIKI